MTTEALTTVETTLDELRRTLRSFDRNAINTIPFEGSWTAGQVMDHILKSGFGITKTLKGNAKPTERNPAEKVEQVRSIFLNFDTKMKAPDFIIPSDGPHEQQEQLAAIEKLRGRYAEIIQSSELSETCTDFELPNIGEFTRLEWIYFFAYHTQRHTHQLKKIVTYL